MTALPICAFEYEFTGKERDAESGLDYFGARYYGSNMGRWTRPNYSDDPDPVPFADMSDPQTLNLYAYVGNNPLSQADGDGHCYNANNSTALFCIKTFFKNLFSGGGASDGSTTQVTVNIGALGPVASGAVKEVVNEANGLASYFPRRNNNGGVAPPNLEISGSGEKSGSMAAMVGMFFIPGGGEVEGISRLSLLEDVTNPALRKAIQTLYREGATIGDGSTAAAAEYEIRTGQQVGGRSHSIKAR